MEDKSYGRQRMARVEFLERGKDTVLQFVQTNPLTKRDTPKINGSFGGFIALVVCLVLVIIVSCIGVVFLIREQKIYDQEQAHRRSYQRSSGRHCSSYLYHNDSMMKSWRRRLATLFNRRDANDNSQARPDTSRVKMRGSREHGWVQAGMEDDWEADLVEERRQRVAQLGISEVSAQNPPSLISAVSIMRSTPVSRSNSDSTSSVRFDLSPVRGLANHDRHPSPHQTLPNIHSQLPSSSPSPASSLVRVRPPEPVSGGSTPDSSRQLVSPQSVRTFPGGTKFIEAL